MHQLIEDMLSGFGSIIGKELPRYKNHVYRVYLNCLLLDPAAENREKYAIAAVFHDIGIWTDDTFDYLAPSIRQASLYLAGINKQQWTPEIASMIYWHHKLSQYKGEHEKTVETFRKADWMDVSLGLLTFGFDKQKIRRARRKFPNAGFHLFLVKQSVKNFFKHPLNPIPVFKK